MGRRTGVCVGYQCVGSRFWGRMPCVLGVICVRLGDNSPLTGGRGGVGGTKK
jgi:hypothetical protein